MRVLVDTSVWIEFFRPRPALSETSLATFSDLLTDDCVVTVHPIRAELLSGRLDGGRKVLVSEVLSAVGGIDPDWNGSDVWKRIIEMAGLAHQESLPVPGIVDRMILAAAERARVSLWALDQTMLKLARTLGIHIFG